MKRRVFNILSAASLLVAVGIAGLWVRSCWVADLANFRTSSRTCEISSIVGQIVILIYYPDLRPNGVQSGPIHNAPQFEARRLIKFCIEKDPPARYAVIFPHWVPMVLFAILPAMWLVLHRHPRLKAGPGCASCGYDLRASKDKCPECGATIESKAA